MQTSIVAIFLLRTSQGRKWLQGAESYGKMWQRGDVIGCMIDMNDKTISTLALLLSASHDASSTLFCEHVLQASLSTAS